MATGEDLYVLQVGWDQAPMAPKTRLRASQGQGWASPKFYKVLPQDFVSTVVFQVTPPGTPIFGYTAITYGTLYYWVARRLRGPITFMMAAVLVYTLNMSDLAQSLAGTGIPSHFLFMITGGYRFVSVFANMITNTQNAIKLRGWDNEKNN